MFIVGFSLISRSCRDLWIHFFDKKKGRIVFKLVTEIIKATHVLIISLEK